MSTPILKTLKADPNNKLDFSRHKHELKGGALKVWKEFAKEHPYWWSLTDLPTVERYCQLVHIERTFRLKFDRAGADLDAMKLVWAMIKQVSLEIKSAEYSLGLTPQSRAALKLKEPADQAAREEASKKGGKALDPAKL